MFKKYQVTTTWISSEPLVESVHAKSTNLTVTTYLLDNMAEQLIMRGELHGHSGWVTSLATSMEKYVRYCRKSMDKSGKEAGEDEEEQEEQE